MGSNSELHVVLTTKLSLDRKTMYMKLILLDYFPVLLLFCWWFVMYGVDAPLITLTAETCSMALILTVCLRYGGGVYSNILKRRQIWRISFNLLKPYIIVR
ncbi:uncharacterized protein LOC112098438 isoform X3 [Citrus clementina]|nr:uncharacterized protein LOC112098438 isoform X3 [Citrus x clementina]